MTSHLLDLARRVEGLTGPDREVDDAIIDALGWRNDFGVPIPPGFVGLPAYTGSIDAALMLVPEGHAWAITNIEGGDYTSFNFDRPTAVVQRKAGDIMALHVSAATPALALCAASLRAIAGDVR